ncbi:hypothetical protein IGI46_001011 [Enterococcus sp. AZ163]
MDVFDTVSHAYHQKIAKDRANEERIVVNPPSLGNLPGEGEVTYSSEVQEVLIPYTTREDSYNYYEVHNYVNDVNQENTQVLQTYDDELKARETYTYGNERLSYMNEQTKEEYQYLTNARGSVTGMTQDGELNSTNSYSVFGMSEEVDDTGNPYGYTGEAQDITGYNYLRARYYDSQTGTFLTQDSYEGEEDNPLSQNGYTYVENNPINYTDPTGHKKKMFASVKSFGNTMKSVANRIVNSVKRTVENVKYLIGVNPYPSVRNNNSFISGKSSSSSFGFGNAVKQVAQNVYRQQQINIAYANAIGNSVERRTKEAMNLLRNWNKSMKETLTKFCKTAPKAKKDKHQSAGVVALAPGATGSLPAAGKVIGKTTVKILGKAVWIYTVWDLTNKAVNYIEHGDTNDMVVGGDLEPFNPKSGRRIKRDGRGSGKKGIGYVDSKGNVWSEDEAPVTDSHGGSKWKKYKNKRDFEKDKREGTYNEDGQRIRD